MLKQRPCNNARGDGRARNLGNKNKQAIKRELIAYGFKIALLFAGASGLLGIAFGYFLRFIISLGKRGSMELEIKQMTLTAKEEAQKIIEEADKRRQK